MTRQRLAEDLVKIARALDLASAALSRLAVEVLEEEPGTRVSGEVSPAHDRSVATESRSGFLEVPR